MPQKTVSTSPRARELAERLEHSPAPRLYMDLAREHQAAGNLEEAASTCRQALEKHPSYHSARVLLAKLLVELDRFGEAVAELASVVRQAPDNLLARKLLGEAQAGSGDREGALETLRHLRLLNPGDESVEARIREIEGGERTPVPAPGEPGVAAPESPPPPPGEAAAGAIEAEEVVEAEEVPETAEVDAAPPDAGWEMPSARAEDVEVEIERPPAEEPVPPPGEAAPVAPQPGVAPAAAKEKAPQRAEEKASALPTPTLAEIYYSQGLPEKAVETYERVLQGDPGNEEARNRLRQIRSELPRAASVARRKMRALETWLGRIRRSRDAQGGA